MNFGISSLARDYVRSRATGVMGGLCRIERVTKGEHDEETLVYTPGARTTIYEGIFRVWEVSGASTVTIGGENDLDISSTQFSTPWDAPVARKDDEVIILEHHDQAMVGKRLQIQSTAKAGELRATRRYNVTVVQEKRQ